MLPFHPPLWRAQLGALLLWLLAAIPVVVVVLYFGLRGVFWRVLARQAPATLPAD